jgi:hypothetical protein
MMSLSGFSQAHNHNHDENGDHADHIENGTHTGVPCQKAKSDSLH